MRQCADVDHVGDVVLQVVRQTGFLHKLVDRHGVVGNVVTAGWNRQRVVVQNDATGSDAGHVVGEAARIQADHDVVAIAPGQIAVFAQADDVPGGQALDVAGKECIRN